MFSSPPPTTDTEYNEIEELNQTQNYTRPPSPTGIAVKISSKQASPRGESSNLDHFVDELLEDSTAAHEQKKDHLPTEAVKINTKNSIKNQESLKSQRISHNSDISDLIEFGLGNNEVSSLDLGSRPPEEIYHTVPGRRRDRHIILDDDSDKKDHAVFVEVFIHISKNL
jgi:hypothetical protein